MATAPTHVQHRHPQSSRFALVAGVLLVGIAIAFVVQQAFFRDSTRNVVAGSGVAATQARTVASFRSVDLRGANNVTVSVGGTQSVVVRGDDNLIGRVTTRVHGGELAIGNTGSFTTIRPMSVAITVPALTAVKLSGSGNVSVAGIRAGRFAVSLPGSGTVRATGAVNRLDVALDGAGDAQLRGLIARDVHARVGGSGQVVVYATATLDASVPGTGTIVYFGKPPSVQKSVTGVGAVTPASPSL